MQWTFYAADISNEIFYIGKYHLAAENAENSKERLSQQFQSEQKMLKGGGGEGYKNDPPNFSKYVLVKQPIKHI